MKTRIRTAAMTAGICLIWGASAAHAENWVRVVDNPGGNVTYVDVDVDSIRKDADGLVYFSQQDDWDSETIAVNCQTRERYTLDYWKARGGDWRSHPLETTGIGNDVLDFVCARAK